MLDRFQLRRELHVGVGGEVWLARDGDGQLYAVKLATELEAAARLRREAAALARLDHPNIVRLVDAGTFGRGGHCVVLEYVEGATLEKVLRVTSPSAPRAVGWSRQICQALQHCHEAGVVHRDVKASNILLGRDARGRDRLVLVDLGIALIDGVGELPEATAGLLGSVHTISPEQVRGDDVDGRADLYAVGVVLYRMLTDHYPFHARNPAEVLAAHTSREPPPLGQHKPTLRLADGLEVTVLRCLAKFPTLRHATAAELDAALADVEYVPQRDWVRVTGFDLSIAPETAPGVPPPQVTRWGVMAAVIGITAVVVAALVAVF